MSFLTKYIAPAAALAVLAACGEGDRTTQRVEYAPQMYVSIPYEPVSQVEPNKYNPNGTNERTPPQGTVPRRSWAGQSRTELASNIMVYNLGPDDIDAAETLKNPVPLNDQTLAEGKALYQRYCSACHGEQGDGQGKVAAQYKGVPAYNAGAVKGLSEGHVFHVITWGIRRMWPHGTQIDPQERWKIVHYVQTLQNK
ncbi:Cytochrome c, mono-and diheme variants [Catalinimonas alkaloidigena]|uniref:Cytochrome c, mono-and diheme variants n=1 Tax=Catalinimonas alkaloidigena TaxID=1075417 RepID=A0A1G9BHM2_9BACT|nr:cytochrome c [Catalinimonas alkaloidigena]SDK38992.1 Cytochrome c, mono-and diheme variants [Catalinimonas alkaloidigena]